MALRNIVRFICCALIFPPMSFPAAGDENRWWPVQTMPKALVRLQNDLPAPRACCDMMAQSVAGLAAKAVNEGRGDEMVWVGTDNIDIEDWFARLAKRHPQLELRGTFALWDLVDRYARKGIIKGYILYRSDHSQGELSQHRPGIDCSVNVATSLAGLLDGIIVDEGIEGEAKQHGLKMLLDVRGKTQAWCFDRHRDQFSRHMLCTQDPRKPNARDLAIAQKTLTVFGYAEPVPAAMKWLEPLSPILGWNGGDEFKTTQLSTLWGHIQTVTDWAVNLPVLMAGTERAEPSKVKSFDPRTVDWNDRRSAVSFIRSDGDNVNTYEGSFFRGSEGRSYWGNPDRGKIPFGWSCCFAHLAQLCPEAIEFAAATQSPNDWFLEWGGGYYYPDLFGRDRTNRWELLAQHARRTCALMRRTNTRVIGFNVAELDSPDALKSYQVFAGQTDGLLGILVWQYDCYEAGAGRVFWVWDRNGVEVPVISARCSIWTDTNHRPRAGTPAKVAREIRQTVENAPPAELPRYDWVNSHAWSWFKKAPGADENAEDMPQENAEAQGGMRGYSPVTWCVERLPAGIRTVGPEELVWRIRMKHNPQQTRKLIQDWPG
jgi:GxGYxYP putative glycoside hydrolase C-terminal domain/GxGYxY sequence motif in domain of unknown function N-terminal